MHCDSVIHAKLKYLQQKTALCCHVVCLTTFSDYDDGDTISRAVALWLLRSRELHNIPQSVMNTITNDIQFLFDTVIDNLKYKIGSTFNNAANIREAKELINNHLCSPNYHIFQGIETHAKQMSYFRQTFGLVVSFHYCFI